MIAQEEVDAKDDAPALSLETPALNLEDEFDKIFQPYAEDAGITKEEIDDELREARSRFSKLENKGCHEKPEGRRLREKIVDLIRLVELRNLIILNENTSEMTGVRDESKEQVVGTYGDKTVVTDRCCVVM